RRQHELAGLFLVAEQRPGRHDPPRLGPCRQSGLLTCARSVKKTWGRDEVHALDELAFLLIGHQDRAPTLGSDRVRAAWSAKAAATPALVRTQDRGVDVAEAIDLQRIQDADVHVPELSEVASGVHRAPLQRPVPGP